MKKKIAAGLVLLLIVSVGIVYVVSTQPLSIEVVQFRIKNREIYQMMKKQELVYTPMERIEERGIEEEIGIGYIFDLEKKQYVQDYQEARAEAADSYAWRIEENKLQLARRSTESTLSDFRKESDGQWYATYELRGEDGSYAKYIAKIE